MKTRYFNKYKDIQLMKRLESLYKEANFSYPFILLEDHETVIGYLTLDLEESLIVDGFAQTMEGLELLIKKAMVLMRLKKEQIKISKQLLQQLPFPYHPLFEKEDQEHLFIQNTFVNKTPLLKVGHFQCGKRNLITDVEGVLVGHTTLSKGSIQTGVTAILPHQGNIFKEKVIASSYVFNGFGKSMGLVQVDELGTIETPLLLTNTLSIGIVSDALISHTLLQNEDIGITTGTLNPIVLECNDSSLNDIRQRVIQEQDVFAAINSATDAFLQGSVGAGTGMTTLGFKGGIGSASRVFRIAGSVYTVGVLVNSNFQGSNPKHLTVCGRHVQGILEEKNPKPDQGSIIIVVATDALLDARQLKRVCKRSILGLSRTGAYASNGSGDIVVGFTTANKVKHYQKEKELISRLADDLLDPLFQATVEATEEAVLNSMLFSKTTKGVRDFTSYSIEEINELFDDLYII